MKGFLAALMMFTRLPLWRVVQVDKTYFTEAIKYWPLIGFVTGATTAITLWVASGLLPALPACVLAILARLLLTGALHEDGLADFIDGFGGGKSKENILSIMKDSHIGCYGTIGLVGYFLLYVSLLSVFDAMEALAIVFAADCFSKLCAAVMINTLSYVRKEEESKVSLLYKKIGMPAFIVVGIISVIPLFFISDRLITLAIIPTILAAVCLHRYLKRKIGGYTGDCCGASVLIIEQVFYLSAVIIYCL